MIEKFYRHLMRVIFYDENEKRVFVEIPSYKYDIAFAFPINIFPDPMKENLKKVGFRFHAKINSRCLDIDDLKICDIEEK